MRRNGIKFSQLSQNFDLTIAETNIPRFGAILGTFRRHFKQIFQDEKIRFEVQELAFVGEAIQIVFVLEIQLLQVVVIEQFSSWPVRYRVFDDNWLG